MSAPGGGGVPLSGMLPTMGDSAGNRPTMNLRLSKFNMNMIPDDGVVLFIGRRGTGKSWLIKDLMWYKQRFPIGTVISGTEGANAFYSAMVPSLFIHDEVNTNTIANVLKRQEAVTKQIRKETDTRGSSAIDRRAFIIMDDCLYDNRWTTDKFIRSLFMNGRHYGLLYILAIQYVMGIPPVLRGQVDYVFILRENQVAARRRIYEQFAGIFPTFELFCQIMDQCTENYECLVIHNGARTNKLEDCVYWYRASPHPDFKIGSADHWARSVEYERQKELAEAAGETGNTLTTGGTTTKGPIISVRKY
jgi:hypothetical protein